MWRRTDKTEELLREMIDFQHEHIRFLEFIIAQMIKNDMDDAEGDEGSSVPPPEQKKTVQPEVEPVKPEWIKGYH